MNNNPAHSSLEEAIKIRCRHCSIQETCRRKARKERYEDSGIVTYCTLTPDRKKKRKKKRG